jgi:hypothetical protein
VLPLLVGVGGTQGVTHPKRKPSKYERRAAGYASPGDSAKVCPDFALILLRARLPSGRTAMGGTPTSISRRYADHEGFAG